MEEGKRGKEGGKEERGKEEKRKGEGGKEAGGQHLPVVRMEEREPPERDWSRSRSRRSRRKEQEQEQEQQRCLLPGSFLSFAFLRSPLRNAEPISRAFKSKSALRYSFEFKSRQNGSKGMKFHCNIFHVIFTPPSPSSPHLTLN